LQAVAMAESICEIGNKCCCERRYYLRTMIDVTRIAQTIRQHRAIE
jgi:hypothetical protein